jgi:hypothetical protein
LHRLLCLARVPIVYGVQQEHEAASGRLPGSDVIMTNKIASTFSAFPEYPTASLSVRFILGVECHCGQSAAPIIYYLLDTIIPFNNVLLALGGSEWQSDK